MTRFLVPGIILLALWLLLSDLNVSSLALGIPVLLATLAITRELSGEPRKDRAGRYKLCPLAALAFAGFFIRQSLHGAWRVLWLIWDRKTMAEQTLCCYPIQTVRGTKRQFLLYCINLLPGTLVLFDHDQGVELHLLPPASDQLHDLGLLENRIASLGIREGI